MEDIGIGMQFGELADKGLNIEDENNYAYIMDGTSAHVDKLDTEIGIFNMGEYGQSDNDDIRGLRNMLLFNMQNVEIVVKQIMKQVKIMIICCSNVFQEKEMNLPTAEVKMKNFVSNVDLLVFKAKGVKFHDVYQVKKAIVLMCAIIIMIMQKKDVEVDNAQILLYWIILFVQDQLMIMIPEIILQFN
ncbi:MAG: hypothetical protein EZS28_017960 [Streblomastix strix]|uniref:Uncharacterized protein n=2 Tax=Streblomastix strix TaxID=222440 RepID=A0A5J4VVV9_9EUKA|nr:MAG: hypothetical protein EZS28_017960 [Streblomastix strix]